MQGNLLMDDVITCCILQKSIAQVGPSRYLCKYYVLKETVMDWHSPYGAVLQCTTAKHSFGARRDCGRVGQEGQVFLSHQKKLGNLAILSAPQRVLTLLPHLLPLPASPTTKLCVRSGWTLVLALSRASFMVVPLKSLFPSKKPKPHLIVLLCFF